MEWPLGKLAGSKWTRCGTTSGRRRAKNPFKDWQSSKPLPNEPRRKPVARNRRFKQRNPARIPVAIVRFVPEPSAVTSFAACDIHFGPAQSSEQMVINCFEASFVNLRYVFYQQPGANRTEKKVKQRGRFDG